jgi:hypothetical protein
MAGRSKIEDHPRKKELIKAIVAGKSFRRIATQFSVSEAAVRRYLRSKLVQRAAAATAKREELDGELVFDTIRWVFNRMKKLYDACDDYLADPQNPERYTLTPHAHELDVIYSVDEVVEGAKGPRTKTVLRKESLKNMIDRVLGAMRGDLIEVRYRHADPRRLIVETAATLTKQLELVAKIEGKVKEAQVNIFAGPLWSELQAALLEVTKDAPEMRQKLADRLSRIADAAVEPGRSA